MSTNMNTMIELHQAVKPLAYIDGGTGSMLIQATLAGILTTSYVAKGQIMRLTAAIRNLFNRNRHDS